MEKGNSLEKFRRLLWLGRIVAAVFAAFFMIGIIGNLMGHIVSPESELAKLARWGHEGAPQEVMLGSIYVMIAVSLWEAVKKPAQRWRQIDFALYANVVYSIAMVLLSSVRRHSMQYLWGDSLLTIIPTAILAYAWLPARNSAVSAD